MSKIKGHWFCDYCDDVVYMSYERVTVKDVPCPSCSRLACNFVPAALSRAVIGENWFTAMRRAVDNATAPELPIND